MTSNLSPEMRLLSTLSLHPQRPADIGRFAALDLSAIDWQRFLALVDRHDVGVPVSTTVRNHLSGVVPPPVQGELLRREKRNSYHVLGQLAELARLVRSFAAEGVTVWPLKGPLMSWQLFGRADFRRSSDLDLLVRPEDLSPAERVLLSSGYIRVCPPPQTTPRQWRFYNRFAHHSKHVQPERRHRVELHWSMANSHLLPPALARDMVSRALPVDYAGFTAPALTVEDTAMYLLIHGATHNWIQLKWLLDVAACLRREPPADWGAVARMMTAAGLERLLAQGLLLARDLFEIPPPPDVNPEILRDPKARGLAELSVSGLREPGGSSQIALPGGGLRHIRYLRRLKDDREYRRSIWNTLWFNEHDWYEVALPDWLFPLYFPMRPFLWLWRKFRRPAA